MVWNLALQKAKVRSPRSAARPKNGTWRAVVKMAYVEMII
jgi:hypothetical protein